MKKIVFLALTVISFSCQKKYSCVCESVSRKCDTIIIEETTTKIGSKGFSDDCEKNESKNMDLVNCRLE